MAKPTREFENVRIFNRNFSGKESKYNKAGNRNFCLELSDEEAFNLKEEGWNIKEYENRDGDKKYYVSINVSYGKSINPNVYLITNGEKILLDETTVGQIDNIDISRVDLVVRPYEWDTGKIKGYVKNMYVTAEEDRFASYYR